MIGLLPQILALSLNIFARAGGGGSSSGGGGSSGGSSFSSGSTGSGDSGGSADYGLMMVFLAIAFVLFLVITIGVVVGLLIANKKRKERIQGELSQAATKDVMWNPESITQYASQLFGRFQADWSQMNAESMKTYLSPNYAAHVGLMLYAMNQMGRQNQMSDITIEEAEIIEVADSEDNSQDRVTVRFRARAHDVLVDKTAGVNLTDSTDSFTENWVFVRADNVWLLENIKQATEDNSLVDKSMKDFASQNSMYFSPDWGRLLLPTRGQLFGGASFEKSDVNNHVIGLWGNQLLVQMCTYSYNATNNFSSSTTLFSTGNDSDKNWSNDNEGKTVYYLVAQINLPKAYGGILVQRKSKGFLGFGGNKAPQGYQKITLEWGDFNERYDVFATDADKVNSFELLNPSFMAWLYDQDLQVNIEVVDSVVYLYSAQNENNANNYPAMMDILKASHKELKM